MKSKSHSCEPLEARRLLAIVYVDANAPGTIQDGTTWQRAYKELRDAPTVSGDEVRVANGTYKPTSSTDTGVSFSLRNGVQIKGGYAGFGAADPNARDISGNLTTLSGALSSTAFSSSVVVAGFSIDSTAVLDGFRITRGGSPYISGFSGGGLRIESGSPTIRNCLFENNTASRGGAVYISNINSSTTDAVFEDCVFQRNRRLIGTIDGGRGAIAISDKRVTLNNCKFVENEASNGSAIYAESTRTVLTMNGCTFTRNDGTVVIFGGLGEDLIASNCQFINNFGGAIATNRAASVQLANCRFVGQAGTAISTNSASTTITQCLFAGNTGTIVGAVSVTDSTATITNSTFFKNRATNSNAIAQAVRSVGILPVKVINCVVWDNIGAGPPLGWANAPIAVSHSNIEGGYAGTGNISAEPVFVDAAGFDDVAGTKDDDLRLRAISPGVDAGDNSADGLIGISSDLAGSSRFADVTSMPDTGAGTAPLVDMGAYETSPASVAEAFGPYRVQTGGEVTLRSDGYSAAPGQLTYEWDLDNDGQFDDATGQSPTFSAATISSAATVTVRLRITDSLLNSVTDTATVKVIPSIIYVDDSATGANNGSSWSNAYTSLRTAMSDAFEGAEIRVAQGVYKPTSLTEFDVWFEVKDGFKIAGGYAGVGAPDPDARNIATFVTTLSGDIGLAGYFWDNTHIIEAVNANNWLLDGFTIAHGYSSFVAPVGAGINVVGGSAVVRNCTFERNHGDYGPGVTGIAANLTLESCIFRGNSGVRGGAIAVSGNPVVAITTRIVNCVFVGNAGYYGGAIWYDYGPQLSLIVVNCVLAGNVVDPTFGGSGAALFRESTGFGNSFRMDNSIVWNNSPANSQLSSVATMPINFSVVPTNPGASVSGTGNISLDPKFVRNPSPGADSVWGTADDDFGDLRLQSTSPAVDRGSNALVPAGVSQDFSGKPRFVDFPNVQNGAGVVVDMGAYESPATLSAAVPDYRFDAVQPMLRIAFNANLNPATLTAADLTLLNLDTNSPVDVSGTATAVYNSAAFAAEFIFAPSLPDGNYRATLPAGTVSDAAGSALSAGATADFFVLAGDANRDRTVNINDFSILASRFNLPGVFSQGDFNYDGVTNISDFAILASKFNTSLPAARTPNMLGTPRTTKRFVDVMRLDLDELQ